MLLNNKGIILIFAETIEFENLQFFNHAEIKFSFNDFKTVFDSFKRNSENRLSIIQGIRRENVSEMILENITDFHSKDFLLNIKSIENLSINEILKISGTVFERSIDYYKKAAEMLERHADLSKVLTEIADSHTHDYNHMVHLN